MTAYKPAKGIPKKPMRRQMRGDHRKLKSVKTNQKQRHGLWRKDFLMA